MFKNIKSLYKINISNKKIITYMKFTQRLVEKYGDSCLHFAVCAWLTALLSPFGWVGVIIGFLISCIISYIKEKYLDVVFEKNDLYGGILGSLTSIILFAIISIFI